ncbi:hypothetical protein FB451DRAFT_1512395 [Mycena latifolia]|nr:hypothetical protein FB451DRAFT_1512395 [Mycena latifolia]
MFLYGGESECKRAQAQVNARTSYTSQPSQIQTPLGAQVNLPSQSGKPPNLSVSTTQYAVYSFPPTWPVYTKLGNWFENYAEAMELDVWTLSTVVSACKNDTGTWEVLVNRGGKERIFKVKHLIFATGLGEGEGNFPTYPGMILHSTQHKRATDHAGKKVIVVEHALPRSSTYVMTTKNGWKHIMGGSYWEGGPPVEIADRVNTSFPHVMSIGLNQRLALKIAEDDNQMIIDGKIKLKNDNQIAEFTESGLKFDKGSELSADVVVFRLPASAARPTACAPSAETRSAISVSRFRG